LDARHEAGSNLAIHPLGSPELLGELSHAFSLRSQQADSFNFGSTQPAPRWPSDVLSDSTGLIHQD
jgi:hypothetical protein